MGVAEGAKLALESRFVGGLPLVNALLDRLTVDRLLATALPSSGRVSPAQALGVLLRNIVLNDRQPIYTHAEWAHRAEPALIGLAEGSAACLNDDRVGRALDRLFDADRAALLTAIVLRTIREFQVELDQLHNDSTTHIETWETLCRLAGRPDFLYVADCKLCSTATLAHKEG
ncbi:MAG: DUF4277 domain-containing protein [Acidobacteria bacterium]|nr:DUF4277 domain-containing protein [Acidobacteriota bacterium]